MWIPMFAEMPSMSEGLTYSVNPDGATCTITGIGTCTDVELYIPAEIDGYTVTGIGDYAFDGCNNLTSINIPDSVTGIGNDAFYNCSSLTNVYISDIVKWCDISFSSSD